MHNFLLYFEIYFLSTLGNILLCLWASTEAAESSAISAIFSNTQRVSNLQNINYPSRGYTIANFNNNL